MDKNKRDLILAVGAMTLFLGTLTKNIFFSKKNPPPVPPPGVTSASAPVEAFNVPQFVANMKASDALMKDQAKYWDNEFGRDPFMPEAKVSVAGTAQDLAVTGIFWDEENPKVVVNGKMLGKNDIIMGYKVMEIRLKTVVFSAGDQSIELSPFSSPVSDTPASN